MSTRDGSVITTAGELVREGVLQGSVRRPMALPARVTGGEVLGAVELETTVGRVVALVVQHCTGAAVPVTMFVWYDRATNTMRAHDASQPLPPL